MHKNRGVKVPYSPLGDGGELKTDSEAFQKKQKGKKRREKLRGKSILRKAFYSYGTLFTPEKNDR